MDRIWIDGCWDFGHHGHSGALLQAKQMGKQLIVGVHSDDEIMLHKGPPVMTLEERICVVQACKWTDQVVPDAPYVTDTKWLNKYNCWYVVHGDDITTDANGEDCYAAVKAACRFKVCKRTPQISTTDLVGRMLLCSRAHLLPPNSEQIWNEETIEAYKRYCAPASGFGVGTLLLRYNAGSVREVIPGIEPASGEMVVYVDGAFDLFSPGHIEMLRSVFEKQRNSYVVVGIHDDYTVNREKGYNYPIMNIIERILCVLQCRYVHAVVVSAPYSPSESFLTSTLPKSLRPKLVYHGPTQLQGDDIYKDPKNLGMYREIGFHKYADLSALSIVNRILERRTLFEERQRKKGAKAVHEEDLRKRDMN
ncbi:Ethanolamine-phosphate cytidylyltransferase [Neolecta irregularis DAH-3]|uniref:ethanolamine-phosphate cytidylyltransferase n=1 Tax=Neolecta irregularis (strain DAH-3) TaxID=1198029 RepID=A0A1U7LUU3_NEOID|nr:Ethanolamine-phosphate cytidylyltransferase [Neolecta irregularis DAH-3]|eukprot:OLL26414.1 Ethanolamine-phosphate cytidylyltransferase [Neolecta irregularis DAH-3]